MTFLVILKRFEVWLLAIIVVALLIFALRPEPVSPDPETITNMAEVTQPGSTKIPDTGDAPLPVNTVTVHDVKVTESKEGVIVELTLSGRSTSGADLTLDESTITATTGEGEPVTRFFEPFRKPAVLLASEDSLATIRWWLERPAGVIWLDLQGQRLKAELP